MPVVVTAALTGALATRQQCPAIPYTAKEIAEEGKRALDAGATILHIHARQDDGKPAFDVESYQRIDDEVRSRCPGVIVNYSTGAVNVDRETRVHHVRKLKPEIAALNMGSMNYAIYSEKTKQFYHDHVFQNPFQDIVFYLEAMREAGTTPEMECFDCGHIANAEPLKDMALLKPPFVYSLVMGVLGGIPATTGNLVRQAEALPKDAVWQCIGIGMAQWRLLPVAVSLKGNVRVGLEDNFYLQAGELAKSNADLVANAVRMIEDMGERPATLPETRELLGRP